MALACAGAAVGQAPPVQMSPSGRFSLRLPPGWRQITPDEAHRLTRSPGALLPPGLLTPRAAAFYPYGDVDQWLRGGFDGRCMTVALLDGEPEMDASGLAALRRGPREADRTGWHRRVETAEVVDLASGDAAIRCLTSLTHPGWKGAFEALELFVPTAGKTLALAFRAPAADFDTWRDVYATAAASVTVARHARGPATLEGRLLTPLLVGAFVGILLLVLRRRATS